MGEIICPQPKFTPAKFGIGYPLEITTKCFPSLEDLEDEEIEVLENISLPNDLENLDKEEDIYEDTSEERKAGSKISAKSAKSEIKKKKVRKGPLELHAVKLGKEICYPVPVLAPLPGDVEINFDLLFSRGFSLRDVFEHFFSFKQYLKMGLTLDMILEGDFTLEELLYYGISLGDLFKLIGDPTLLAQLLGAKTSSMLRGERERQEMAQRLMDINERERQGMMEDGLGNLFLDIATQARYVSPTCNCLDRLGMCLCNLPMDKENAQFVSKKLIRYFEEGIYPSIHSDGEKTLAIDKEPTEVEEIEQVIEDKTESIHMAEEMEEGEDAEEEGEDEEMDEAKKVIQASSPLAEVERQLKSMCPSCKSVMTNLLKVLKLPRKVLLDLEFSKDDIMQQLSTTCSSSMSHPKFTGNACCD